MKFFAGVIAAIALVSALVGCQSSVAGVNLQVGDCYNEAQSVDANGDPSRAYVVVDCTMAHDDEVFSSFDYPNVTSFPGYEAIGTIQQTQCRTDFKPYVGIAWDQSSYTIKYPSPDEATWAGGDHAIHCLLADARAGQTTGSARETTR